MNEMSVNANDEVLFSMESSMYRSKLACYQDRLSITVPSNTGKGCLSAPAFLWLFGSLKTSTIPFSDLRTIFYTLYAVNGQVTHEVKFCPALDDDVLFTVSGRSEIPRVVGLLELITKINPEVEFYFADRTGQFGAFKSELIKWQ